MTDPVGEIARTSATRLAGLWGEAALPAEVETALDHEAGTPRAYADPVSIASLIVAIASLAWTIYAELRRSPVELANAVRQRWAQDHAVDQRTSSVIDIVAEETVKHSER